VIAFEQLQVHMGRFSSVIHWTLANFIQPPPHITVYASGLVFRCACVTKGRAKAWAALQCKGRGSFFASLSLCKGNPRALWRSHNHTGYQRGNPKCINNREYRGRGEYHLAEGKSKEKSLRIPTASEPVLCTPLTAARAIAQYSLEILALTPLYLDAAYQAARFTSEAVPTSEFLKRCGSEAEFRTGRRTSGIGTGVRTGFRSGIGIGSREGVVP
jgi:hypothetical protein